jgi:hypothetical protein
LSIKSGKNFHSFNGLPIQKRSGISNLEVVISGTVNGRFGRLFVVSRGIPSRQDQGDDQDRDGKGFKKSFYIGVFHNRLVLKGYV